MNKVLPALLTLTTLAAGVAAAQDARQIVEESQKRTQSKSQRYEGTLKVIDAKGKISDKRWQYDRIGSHGSSKVVLRFTAPAEVKGVALLVVNHPDRASDQWMYIPEIGRERRIAMQDRSTRFFGTDFSFEDLEERDVDQYDYKLLGEEMIEGAGCWKLEARPRKSKSSQYTHSYLWFRKGSYALARVESFRDTKVIRQLQYSDIRQIQGVWTAHKLDMFDAGRKSRTLLVLDKLSYDVPMQDEQFTLQAIRRAS
ncbi:MAG TPA: outer membrane lipoprotein-sorting protein [Bryobacteraceae bacterium]|nr:outer membrane lipoprotein-sorting protein [Bryobacteraceae bacterium]